MDPILLVIGGIAAILLAAVVFLLWQRTTSGEADHTAQVSQKIDQIMTLHAELTGRLQQLGDSNSAAQAHLTKTISERLDLVNRNVHENLQKSATSTAQSLGELRNRLNVIDKAQTNIRELSDQVTGLQDILANKQARGAFGEIQLENLVKAALPPSAYVFQATLTNGRRADCLLTLPNPPGAIVIDSKFPLDGYRQLREAEDEVSVAAAKRAFRTSIDNHVRDIAERYIVVGETAESALMFLPSEAVYAELHANFADVIDRSYRAHVWIVSPTTLMATLHTMRAVLKDAAMREQAGVIQQEVMTLLEDVGRLGDRITRLQSHFNQAQGDIGQIGISTEKILKRGERIGEIQLESGETAAEEIVPEPPRDAIENQ